MLSKYLNGSRLLKVPKDGRNLRRSGQILSIREYSGPPHGIMATDAFAHTQERLERRGP